MFRISRIGLVGSMVALFGCSEKNPSTPTPTAPVVFENPPELAPNAAGIRELHFGPTEATIEGKRYCLRSYNGSIPGPTIRIPAGTDRKVRVNLYNDFKRNAYREVAEVGQAKGFCYDQNLTNLHAHGSHIQPNHATSDPADPCTGNGCGADSRYYGDNVLLEVPVGESAQYRWDFDEDGTHHPGLNWYHPHIHGSTAVSVTNGAEGALIIEGDIDQVPGITKAKERVMVMAQIGYNTEYAKPLADGQACNDDTLSLTEFDSAVAANKPILINGQVKPHVKTSPNQIERLRVIFAGSPDELGMKLHVGKDAACESFDITKALEITQFARDGITMTQFYKSDTMWVSPGYRIDAVVKMPAEKTTLCLVGRRPSDLTGSVVAIFDVDSANGEPTEVNMPEESAVAATAPPTTWMGLVDGQMQQVTCESVQNIHQKVRLLMPTPGDPPEVTLADQTDIGVCDMPNHTHEVDPNAPVCTCPAPNINCRRFDQRRALNYRSDRVMEVGSTEKWEIRAFDGHPYHVHINPFLVCKNNSNKEPNFPHFRDTFWVQIDDGPQEILMNYSKFSGQFVSHCHKLNHEDGGMMELIEICPAGDTACLCQGMDANGNCISQAGCKADDKQCQFAQTVSDAFPLPPPPNPTLCAP